MQKKKVPLKAELAFVMAFFNLPNIGTVYALKTVHMCRETKRGKIRSRSFLIAYAVNVMF